VAKILLERQTSIREKPTACPAVQHTGVLAAIKASRAYSGEGSRLKFPFIIIRSQLLRRARVVRRVGGVKDVLLQLNVNSRYQLSQ